MTESVRSAGGSSAGYALLATLWICTAISVATLGVLAACTHSIATSRNRVSLARAEWYARACLAEVHNAIEAAHLAELGRPGRRASAWHRVDEIVAASQHGRCTLTAVPAGTRIDINTVDEDVLMTSLTAAGLPLSRADSVSAAILDWLDGDNFTRLFGAERDWYLSRGRVIPPNRPTGDLRELRFVRGVDSVPMLEEVFGVDRDPIAVMHAPRSVLMLLPGFSRELADYVILQRSSGTHPTSFTELVEGVPHGARPAFMDSVPLLPELATLQPVAWLLTARYRTDLPSVTASLEVRLERLGDAVVATRYKSWN